MKDDPALLPERIWAYKTSGSNRNHWKDERYVFWNKRFVKESTEYVRADLVNRPRPEPVAVDVGLLPTCEILDIEALKREVMAAFDAEEGSKYGFEYGAIDWAIDYLVSRNLLRGQDSVAEMMEALPIGFSIYHANNGKWVISDVLNNMIYAEGDLPEALRAAFEKIGGVK